jgi:hypothetical protein
MASKSVMTVMIIVDGAIVMSVIIVVGSFMESIAFIST